MSQEDKATAVLNPDFILQNSKPINCILFSNINKNLFYVGNRNGDITIYNLQSRRSVFSANPNSQPILSIAEIDDNYFLSQSRNGAIFKWKKLDDKNCNFECIYQKEAYTFCQFSLDNVKNLFYMPSSEAGLLDCIDLEKCQKVNEIRPKKDTRVNRGMLMNIKIIESNLMCGYENGELALFDLNTYQEISSMDFFNGQPLISFDFSSKRNIGYCGSAESDLKQFSLNNETFKLNLTVKLVNPGVNVVKIRQSDSMIVACGCWDSRIRVYSLKKATLLVVLDFHKEAVNTIDFSLKDNSMAAGSSDGIISFWNLYNNN